MRPRLTPTVAAAAVATLVTAAGAWASPGPGRSSPRSDDTTRSAATAVAGAPGKDAAEPDGTAAHAASPPSPPAAVAATDDSGHHGGGDH